MNKITFQFILVAIFFSGDSFAQTIDEIINAKKVDQIVRVLSSDSMQGRKAFTPAIDKAADFIASEFKNNGLQYFQSLTSYRQEFSMISPKLISAEGTFDEQPLEPKNILAFTTEADLFINNNSGYETIFIAPDPDFIRTALNYIESNKNYVLIIHPENANNFNRLKRYRGESFKKNNSVVFILSSLTPKNITFA